MSLFYGKPMNTSSMGTLTGSQEAGMNQLLSMFGGQLGKYGDAQNKLMSGTPAFTANMDEIQQRFDPIASAARQRWNDTTSKNITQGFKNMWGSGRQKVLANSQNEMESGLSQLFSQMKGAETDAARKAQQFATQMQLGGMEYTPESMMAKLLGIKGKENIVEPASPGLFGGQGLLGLF